MAKEKISSALRTAVWNRYAGNNAPSCACFAGCGERITISNFVCGHIHASSKGGLTTISNLRPICTNCNLSMGVRHMKQFMKVNGLESPITPKRRGKLRPRMLKLTLEDLLSVASQFEKTALFEIAERKMKPP